MSFSTPPIPGYRVQGQLGKGAFGVVYAALDERVGRPVAIKVLLRADGHESVARFRREREAMARIDHPHVVRVHASGSAAGRPYVVLELLRGGSLSDRLRGAYTREEGLAWVAQAAAGLGALHAEGLVHRDVKPENLLFDGEGRLKVADLGLVGGEDFNSLTNEGTLMGSPAYFAPEVCAGERTRSARGDVYALGATLFEVLTGQLPHPASSLQELLASRQQDPSPDPRRLDPSIPRALAEVCQRAMAGEPGRRYADALAFAEALRGAVEGGGGSRRGRRAALAGLLAVILAAILAGAGWALAGSRPSPGTSPRESPLATGEADLEPRASSSPAAPTPKPSPSFRVLLSYREGRGQLAAPGVGVAVVGTRVLSLERGGATPASFDVPRSGVLGVEQACLREWTLEGELLRSLPLPGAMAMALDPRGERVALALSREVRLLDATTWALVGSLPTDEGSSDQARLIWSASGDRLALCREPRATVWELSSQEQELARIPASRSLVAFSGEDRVLVRPLHAAGAGLELWDLAPAARVRTYPLGAITDASVDAKGRIYAARWEPPALLVLNLEGEVESTTALPAGPTRVDLGPEALVVLAQRYLCRFELPDLTARQIATGERFLFSVTQGRGGEIYALGFGQRLLALAPRLSTLQAPARFGCVRSLYSFGSGEWLLGSSSGLWRIVPGTQPVSLIRPPDRLGRAEVWAHSETGRFTLAGGGRALNKVEVLKNEVERVPRIPAWVRVAALDASGTRILAGVRRSTWGPLLLLDKGVWSPLGPRKGAAVSALRVSAQGVRGWVGRADGSLEEWNLSTRERQYQWGDSARAAVLRIVRAEDGTMFAACEDGRVRRISNTGQELPAIHAHQGPVLDLCVFPERLLSAGADGALRTWRLADGASLGLEWRASPGDAPARLARIPSSERVAVATLRAQLFELTPELGEEK